jgi:putative endopeptidase
MDTLVKPGDNFDAYVNGNWVKNTKIPADKSSYGVFYILNDQAEQDVKDIIETAAKGEFKNGSDEQKIGDFYASFIDTKARDAKCIAPLKEQNNKIEAIKTYSDLAFYFGESNKTGQSIPFSIFVTEDFKNPKEYALATWQSGLGLPEREYYLLQDDKSKALRTKYVAHITKMLTLGGYANPAENAAKILALETLIASKHMKKEDTRNTVLLYNKYQVKDLAKLMPDFDWAAMLRTAELSGQKNIIVTQVDYMKSLNDIIKKTPLDTWKAYLNWTLIHSAAYALSTDIVNENFNFYSKTLYGTTEQRALWRRAVSAVNENLGEVVGKVYVEKHFTPEAKERMTVLVKNLLKAYEESITNLDWMTPTTKKEALDKVKKFMLKIGYPDKWRDYSTLKVEKNDLYGNLKRSEIFEYKRNLNKLGKPVDRAEWGMTPQEVNAYYNPTLNEIVFPAAILQPPFFDMNADDAVNYGSIGAVIGHEIGHGFDDQGSNFDGNGVMRNWWTPEDKAAFSKRTADLVAQYNGFKVFKDLNVNGTFTLGENIGDLGGLSIALKAYQKSLNGKPGPKMDGFTAQQRVFIGYAQSWLSKEREEALRNQVASDPHSPAKFRVNGIVRNIPEFYEAFNVKPTDSLYLAPGKRVRIW